MGSPRKAELAARLAAARKALREARTRSARLEKQVRDGQERLARLAASGQAPTVAPAQQTAATELLQLIGQSPTDAQRVLEGIARTAMRLCEGAFSVVSRHDGDLVHVAAHTHVTAAGVKALERMFPLRPGPTTLLGRVALEGRAVHIPDVRADPAFNPALARALRSRSMLAAPLVRDGRVVGAIAVGRLEHRPFSDAEIARLEAFAHQAVIAIDYVRVSTELQARKADLTEALEQQTATAEILRVISSSPTDIQPVLDAVAESASRLCEAQDTGIFRRDGDRLLLVAHHGAMAAGPVGEFWLPLVRGTVTGRAVLEARTVQVADLQAESDEYPEGSETARRFGHRTTLTIPLIREGLVIGAINLRRTEASLFGDRQVALLETFAAQAVIAIENVRLFKALEARNGELTNALDRQTATADILRVISQARADVEPVFEAIADSVMRLFGAWSAAVFRYEAELIRLAAWRGGLPGTSESVMARLQTPRRPTPDSPRDLAVITRAVQNVLDVQTDPRCGPAFREQASRRGFRSGLAVPMLRGTDVVGAIAVTRERAGGFTPTEIALLETFASQAVIAVENARLLTELQTKNADLTEALEQQTATAEILRVISSSPTDIRPVFLAIAESSVRLCGADYGSANRLEGDTIHLVAQHGQNDRWIEAASRLFPHPLTRDLIGGVAMLDREVVQLDDLQHDPRFPTSLALARTMGYHTALAVPMLRPSGPVGAIVVFRQERRPFTEAEVGLLRTFADQAVIAVENVRLFTELEARNSELRVALEQQTATSELLKVIGRSTFDLQPVFETLAENAVRLCGAKHAFIFRYDGRLLRGVASHNASSELIAYVEQNPIAPGRSSGTARAAAERRIVHIHDIRADPEHTYAHGVDPVRTQLAIPMLRANELLGVTVIYRHEVRPFTDGQIALLETFADQAAIAIENARLLSELQAKNADLTETLEQQTATSEILRVISQSQTDVQPVFDTIVANSVNLCGARMGAVYRFDGELLHLVAHHNYPPAVLAVLQQMHPRPPLPDQASGRAILTRAPAQIADMLTDPVYRTEVALAGGWRSILSVPMLRDDEPIGAIVITRTEAGPFSDGNIQLLKTFADQAVIAIENVRLFKELEARNADLTEALARQTATSEVLRAISQSQTDAQPVFEIIGERARRLCEAEVSVVSTFDGELLQLAALHGVAEESVQIVRDTFPMRPDARTVSSQAFRARAVVHVPDVLAEYYVATTPAHRAAGFRGCLGVPMLREGKVIGVIFLARTKAEAYADSQVELVKTFADQAVIAVENARLFSELQARTAELTSSVERLTALGEVGRAVSSTLDLETVLRTIVSHAVQLTGTEGGSIYEYDAATEEFEIRATLNVAEEIVEAQRSIRPRKGDGVVGQLGVTRQVVQVPDITAVGAYSSRMRDTLVQAGVRSLLAVPLLREDELIGGLVVTRRQTGAFAPEVTELLRTFAAQSALAIQNARLFREIEDKGRQLEVADRHKSEFLANMSHELRTPLNAIIGYSEMLQEDAADLGAEQLTHDLKRINAAGKHLLELINAVLDLSKIEAGKMELYLETFEVAALIRDIAAVIQPLAAKNANRLDVQCPDAIGSMRADLTKVRQTLFNLLSNACKFTDHGTVTLAVGREAGDGAGLMVFSVTDTGIGMTPEQLERLFEAFSQADAATTRKYGGTGLGLALSRRLCRMMGGDIAVASESGRGSTFTIRLPAEVAEPAEPTVVPTAPSAQATAAVATVLVIDDEAAVRDLMQRFLIKEGFRVVLATGGDEGLRLARELQPDAITLDVMMPGMDGWAVLSALKADPDVADIPVIMLTIVDDRNLGYALGASDYLTKPIDRERLLAVLDKHRRDRPILVVDDDASLRDLLRRTLEPQGYMVVEAENGRAALERLRAVSPSAVLLDLMMPEMDGFEFVAEFRRHEAWRAIPIIVITAKDLSREDRDRLNGYVQKILQKGAAGREQLLAEVRELVATSVARRRPRA